MIGVPPVPDLGLVTVHHGRPGVVRLRFSSGDYVWTHRPALARSYTPTYFLPADDPRIAGVHCDPRCRACLHRDPPYIR